MATNWTALTGSDIRKVLDASAQQDPNQNLAEGTLSGDELNLAAANRRDEAVSQAVKTVRGAIRSAGRYPYAITADSVPPEGEYHTLVIAAWRLINSTPGLARSFLAGDGGAETPLAKMYCEAMEWVYGCGAPKVGGLAQGASFTEPTDPVGQDWETAVSATNLAVTGIKWGDSQGDDTEYDAGITEDGIVISRQLNSMNTY
jgi:hypothetical protein